MHYSNYIRVNIQKNNGMENIRFIYYKHSTRNKNNFSYFRIMPAGGCRVCIGNAIEYTSMVQTTKLAAHEKTTIETHEKNNNKNNRTYIIQEIM